MASPFERSPIDGTDDYAVPLTIAENVFLKAMPPVIALRLESPGSETTGERTVQQWALTREPSRVPNGKPQGVPSLSELNTAEHGIGHGHPEGEIADISP